MAGLAASTVLIVQRVIDDASEVPVDPLVRLLEADVAAAFVAAEAQSVFDEDPTMYTLAIDQGYEDRCVDGIRDDFEDFVDPRVRWATPADPYNTPADLTDDEKAKCTVTPLPNLGGS